MPVQRTPPTQTLRLQALARLSLRVEPAVTVLGVVTADSRFTVCLLVLAGCSDDAPSGLTGTVRIDGSSTVAPISEAVAEAFGAVEPGVRVPVGTSGTGGGFKKFIQKEIDICDASRPIKPSEIEQAKAAGVEYIEIPVAYDGLTVVVNPKNDWVDGLSVEELKRIWQRGSTVKTWKDVRPAWPDREIKLFGPGTDSGTFDYFTEEICGKSGACRPDFTPSEDDNVLVQGVAGERDALGYFGFAYYAENQDKLRAVPIAGVTPSIETVNNGTYTPLSRPVFIYVNAAAAPRLEVKRFVEFYLDNAGKLAADVGYIPLPDAVYARAKERFAAGKTGTDVAGVLEGKP